MKKTGMMWGLCVAMGLSTASFAGAKDSYPVYVDTVTRFFSGSMGSARNSTGFQQNLYCYSSTSGYGVCQARDAAGTPASCVTSDANMIAAIRSVNTDSYVSVSYDSSGNCTSILVGTGSHHEPKQP